MGLIPRLPFINKKKKVSPSIKQENIRELVHEELKNYVTREGLQKYIDQIQRNKNTKHAWDALSTRQKIKVLRHVAEKRGIDGK